MDSSPLCTHNGSHELMKSVKLEVTMRIKEEILISHPVQHHKNLLESIMISEAGGETKRHSRSQLHGCIWRF